MAGKYGQNIGIEGRDFTYICTNMCHMGSHMGDI